ncbi:MAG: beta-N-acetylhexosaminidase [Flavisolibacter sp.]
MKYLFSFFILLSIAASAQNTQLSIIPEPVSTVINKGSFTLPKYATIQAGANMNAAVDALTQRLKKATGAEVKSTTNAAEATFRFLLNEKADEKLGKEGYYLTVGTKQVIIRANEPAGIFYGVQTLLQLFPKEIESNEIVNREWLLPAVDITDYPRFAWRGLMFDVVRHFYGKDDVKRFIDEMVRYKYNMLHMHLSDDEGWRIEIKGLPKLTEVGAWNVKKEGYFGTFTPPAPDEPRTQGGFFTHEDIRELVAYAAARYVNIMPEIDVPGHSLAAVASYPELSCTPGADKYVVKSGEPIMDWSHGAPPIALVDNTLCPANEKVYEFLDKVFTQVAELFPFEYIHVGGDEVPQNFWKKTPEILALMKKENLKDMHAVQGYFMRRVEKIVNAKGKKMMGWDEILDAGVAPSAGIMSWRGTKYGIEAAKAGHEVVMSPSTYAYIDYMQGDAFVEPRVYASLPLKKSYEFDPAPEGVNTANIKGGQANLWTEQITNFRIVEYMLWPRGWAIAESVWSPKEKKNWNHFFDKVEDHFQRNEVAEINYAPSVYDPTFSVKKLPGDKMQVAMSSEVDGLDIYYSFSNHYPDRFFPKYTGPLDVPVDAAMLRVITYKGKEPVGRMISIPVQDLKKRAGIN